MNWYRRAQTRKWPLVSCKSHTPAQLDNNKVKNARIIQAPGTKENPVKTGIVIFDDRLKVTELPQLTSHNIAVAVLKLRQNKYRLNISVL